MSEAIVLVPGLWMNAHGMALLGRRFAQAGYRVDRFSYRSMSRAPRENAAVLEELVRTIDTPVIHFVCHSLGGILIRHLFHDFPGQKPGRVVTLGTPHQPCQSAYKLHRFGLGKLLLGKSVVDGLLGNAPDWVRTHELGSIAGRLGIGLGRIFPGLPVPNDGTVTVEETRLDGMRDHAIVHTSHFGMLLSAETAVLSLDFIRHGAFTRV